jgi:hypothetical protein
MVKLFEMQLAEGVKSPPDCPELSAEGKHKLEGYLSGFQFES